MLRLLGGALPVLVSAGLLARPAGCRACHAPYRAVPCGSGIVRLGASRRLPEVKVAWLVLWCRGVPEGAAGWARRNTAVFAGRSRRARGFRAVSPWPIVCSGEELGGRKGIRVSVETPSRSLPLIAFGAAGNVSLATFSQVTCPNVAPVLPLWVPCDLVPWCLTFSEDVHVGSSGARIP